MSSSCETARGPRVLRGAAASRAASVGLPADLPIAARPGDPAAGEAELRAGFEAGYADGRRVADLEARADRELVAARAAALLHDLSRAVRDLEARTTAELGRVEDAIVEGAYRLAEAILGREVEAPAAGRDAVARALALAPRNRQVTVFVHPADLDLLDPDDVPAGVSLTADAGVDRGSCLAEVGDCTIDARLGAALDRAREALR